MNELMNKLNLMDCMEGMKQFPDKYFDLAIVDPPYGVKGKITNGGTWAKKKKRGFLESCCCRSDSVSIRSKTNKITKRLTNKSEKMQIRRWIKNIINRE